MKRKKGNIKSLIEHIKAELLSSSPRPIEIRDDLFLDKLLAGQNEDDDPREDNFEKEADREKGLLWPPFYHGNNTWSYFWFIKNKKNLTKFVLENPDKFEKKKSLPVEDKYPIMHAIYRLFKRLARFVIWLIYVCIGGLWHLIYGNSKNNRNHGTTVCITEKKSHNRIERLIGFVNRKQIDASRWSGLNAIILSIIIVLFICSVINVFMFFVRDVIFFHPEMSINDAGVVKITQPCNVEHYLFLHSCAELWKDTGIDIVEGDKFEVNYSGAFYSTIRDMNNASLHHKEPRYRLMNSRNYGNNQKEDPIVNYCVYNADSARIGQLLFQIVPAGQEPKHQCGDDAIFAVDFSENKNENSTEAQRSGRLRVAVNDIYLPKDRIFEIITSGEMKNDTLKSELLNRALYPISMNQVFMDSELNPSTKDSIRNLFVSVIKKKSTPDVGSLIEIVFSKNDLIREQYRMIRELGVKNFEQKGKGSRKTRKDKSQAIKDSLLNIQHASLFAKIKDLNKYLFEEILPKLDSPDQIQWDSPDFWYNDNAGDLLVNVTVYRDNHSLLSMSGPYRFIEHQFVKPDSTFWLVFGITAFVFLVMFVSDNCHGRKHFKSRLVIRLSQSGQMMNYEREVAELLVKKMNAFDNSETYYAYSLDGGKYMCLGNGGEMVVVGFEGNAGKDVLLIEAEGHNFLDDIVVVKALSDFVRGKYGNKSEGQDKGEESARHWMISAFKKSRD